MYTVQRIQKRDRPVEAKTEEHFNLLKIRNSPEIPTWFGNDVRPTERRFSRNHHLVGRKVCAIKKNRDLTQEFKEQKTRFNSKLKRIY